MAISLSPQQIVEKGIYPLLNINQSWARVKLDAVADVQNGFAFPSANFTTDIGIPLIRIRDILNHTTENCYDGSYDDGYIVKQGDILVGMDGDFNVSVWKGTNGLLNQRVCRIILKSNLYSLKFLIFCLQPYLDAINAETSSITVKHLSLNTLRQIPLPLPPLPEQRRIVAKIEELFSELDKGIETLKTLQQQLKAYRQAVLKSAFEGRLTEEWRLTNNGLPNGNTKSTDHDKIHKYNNAKKKTATASVKYFTSLTIPEPWEWISLEDFSEIKGGITKDSNQDKNNRRPVPYLRVANVQRGYLDLTKIQTIFASEDEIAVLKLQPGDVLFNEGGDRDKLGRGWVWNNEINECIHQNHVFRARFDNSLILSKYVSYFSNSFGQQYFLSEGKQTTNLASINRTKLGKLPIPVCSIQEQAQILMEIESRLSVSDKLEETIGQTLEHAEALRQSILKKAFEGRLLSEAELAEVRRESDWEPASVLLEKIKAQKASIETVTPTKKTARKGKKQT